MAVYTLPKETHQITSSPDETMFYCAANAVFIYDPAEGRNIQRIPKSGNCFVSVADKGNRVAFCKTTGEVMVYDIGSPHTLVYEGKARSNTVCKGAITPDGEYVLIGGKEHVTAISVADGKKHVFYTIEKNHFVSKIDCNKNGILITSKAADINGNPITSAIVCFKCINDPYPQIWRVSKQYDKSFWEAYWVDTDKIALTYCGSAIRGVQYHDTRNENPVIDSPFDVVCESFRYYAAFSHAGEYYALSRGVIQPEYVSLYLAKDNRLLETIQAKYAYDVEFSQKDNYLLIGSSNPPLIHKISHFG